jgi:hypothetical protein
VKAYKNLNESPEDIARGNPMNNTMVKEYLQSVLISPQGYEVKAYSRRAFSPNNRKGLIVYHMFYVYYKDNKAEHTLVYTATPKGSEYHGSWMLDAPSDVDSFNLFLDSPENPWEVEECKGKKGQTTLDLVQTTNKILYRLDRGFTFFGPASVRTPPWYHILWMTFIPPTLQPQLIMLVSIHKDNCSSAILETMAWEDK